MIKIGDVVRLKSDGPNMTVVEISNDGNTAKCVWFSGERFDEVKHNYFATGSLVLAKMDQDL